MPRYIDAEGLNLYDELFMSKDTINKSGVYVRYRAVENLIKNAPTADVQEVKHAHWVNGICTNCGVKKPIVTVYHGVSDIIYQYQGELNYCPNCGAKMDGKEN